jgi:hypothetical protein
MTSAWIGNWYERIKQRVRERGFATATEFADTQPTASLLDLADQLGKDDVAAAQLEKVLLHEAGEADAMEQCAKSLLVRRFHEKLPEGWQQEWDDSPLGSNFRRAGVYGSWCAALPDRYEQIGDAIWDAICAASIPEGWLPASPDDPVLVEIFQKHWRRPEPEKPGK